MSSPSGGYTAWNRTNIVMDKIKLAAGVGLIVTITGTEAKQIESLI